MAEMDLISYLEVDTDSTPTDAGGVTHGDTAAVGSDHVADADYKLQHGRRYHAFRDSKYSLPNDSKESELQHRVWQLSLSDRLHLAPLGPNTPRTLDIGCGTGAWVLEFAARYPHSHVTSIDLSAIQPTTTPPNVNFEISDIWTIAIGVNDWPKLVTNIWENLEPGGWVEFQELLSPFYCDDDTMPPAFRLWNETFPVATAKVVLRLEAILGVPPLLEERGFVALGSATTKWPLGPWAKGEREKQIGAVFQESLCVMGWTEDAVRQHIVKVENEIRAGGTHAYINVNFLWAQKPHDATK
ncbi:hypothetical protein B0A55_11323 [Friedmanniomyces simplex]|uniref:Methyltransferase domain-containing protein n=1 Tax=Friedmanniomyces simplex TaxID=329884 RepID=A0A4V5NBQ7_9PEZI|nr:hypothetical protein B0A55_11323 [Friedmanniomyces simplex]